MRHSSGAAGIDFVVIAIVRQGDALVLVQQQGEQGSYWVLPGGLVEVGELVVEALVREVREEAGVEVTDVGRLALCSQIERGHEQSHIMFFIFEVEAWSGALQSADPDDEILSVEMVPYADALERLEANGGWRGVQEPLRAYLRGEQRPGAMWCFREEAGDQRLVAHIAG